MTAKQPPHRPPTTAPRTEHPELRGPAGRLETLLELPPGADAPPAVAVVCHPHPLYAGTLHNKVVHSLARSALAHGAPALRFNFRGVGASEGRHAEAVGETDDALAALDWAAARWPRAALWLMGFSFGAQVALRAAVERPVAKLVTVAPNAPGFRADHPPPPSCPWLLVQGLADEVVPADAVLAWADGLARRPKIVTLPEVGHYFHGHLNVLKEVVAAFLGEPADAARN